MADIPQEYIIQKFYQYAGYPKFKKISNVYEAGCSMCREGSSWGKKRRLYYLIEDKVICCHNCGWYGDPFKWIMEAGQLTAREIYREVEESDYGYIDIDATEPIKREADHPPKDSINLFDDNQVAYYKQVPVIKTALDYIKTRRLDTAISRCKDLWISLTDFVHKNRLIIPFYDEHGKIAYYQTRGLLKDDLKALPKYLSKPNGDKTLFNYDKVDRSLDNVFIFEGPIDAFFVKNAVATAGIQENSTKSFTKIQETQINKLFLINKIWVLDSQWQDRASLIKSRKLLSDGHTVFIWPRELGQKFKDFNEMAIHYKLDKISTKFILDNSHKGLAGEVRLSPIK